MSEKQIALYARVSSAQQAEAGTIDSQLVAVRERIIADGGTILPQLEFVDDGYRGGTFLRPGLERLRDLAYAGGIDQLYVLDPDRLARKYAYQVMLIDEFQRAGVEVIFLNHRAGRTPEDELLLQVQGMMAEYERAKILERTRRGKRHAASRGAVSVLSGAPYGYRYITKAEGGGQARYEVLADEARVVSQVFEWVGRERATIEEVCRRLERGGALTRAGKTVWNRSTVWEMLKNLTYTGTAPFGRTRLGEPRPRLRPLRGHSGLPKRPCSIHPTPAEQWILVPVPAIVSTDLFQAVQEQLHENRQRIRQRRTGDRYLLQGLVVCGLCGYGFHGRIISPRTENGREYFYYRCNSANAARRTGLAVCQNPVVRGELLDEAVWAEVRALLTDPWRLEQEYRQRLKNPSSEARAITLSGLQTQREKARRGIARLIDSYAEGLVEKDEFEPRIKRLKQRVTELERQTAELAGEQALGHELHLVLGQLEEFAKRVGQGLETADLLARREVIRAVVRRIVVDKGEVNVVFKVGRSPFVPRPDRGVFQHCPSRLHSQMCSRFFKADFHPPAAHKPGQDLQRRVVRIGTDKGLRFIFTLWITHQYPANQDWIVSRFIPNAGLSVDLHLSLAAAVPMLDLKSFPPHLRLIQTLLRRGTARPLHPWSPILSRLPFRGRVPQLGIQAQARNQTKVWPLAHRREQIEHGKTAVADKDQLSIRQGSGSSVA
jgi:site-specific DNA recombinase